MGSGLMGRREVVDDLEARWARTRAGTAEVVVLVGEAGMGKSTVLSWLQGLVEPEGSCIHVRGGGVTAPLAVAEDLVHLLRDSGAEDPPTPGGATVDPIRVGRELRDRLVAAARRAPTAVLIDDLHDADAASRTAMNLALRRLHADRVMVVLAGRPATAVVDFAEGFGTVRLGPLPATTARWLLESRAGTPIDPVVADRLMAVAAGNPLALSHLPACLTADQLAGRQLLPDPLPVEGHLRRVFSRPIDALPPDARRLLEVAAVATDGAWAPITHAFGEGAESALAQLEARGLVRVEDGRIRFQHALLRSAALAGMAWDARRQANRCMAEVDGVSEHDRLVHLATAAIGHDGPLADALEAHGRAMAERGAPEPGGRLLDLAARLSADPTTSALRQIAAAEAEALAGASAPARRRLEAVVDTADDIGVRCEAQRRLAVLEALSGDPLGAWDRLRQAATAEPRQAARWRVHAAMSVPLGMLGLVREIEVEAARAVELSTAGTTARHVAAVTLAHARLAIADDARPDLGDVHAIDLAEAVRHDPLFALHIGRVLGLRERLDDAVAVCDRMASRRVGAGARYSLAMTLGARGEASFRACAWEEAEASLHDAVALGLATGQRAFTTFWLAVRSRLHAARGREDEARQDLDLALRIADELSLVGARYFLQTSAGLLALTTGDPGAAVEALEECRFFEEAAGLLAPNLSRWRPELVEAYLAVGRRHDAETVLGPLVDAATPGASRWTRATAARCQAAVAADVDLDLALGHVRRALETYDPRLDRFDHGRAGLLHADLLHRSGSGGAARAAARAARYAFESLSAPPWADRARCLEDGPPATTATGPAPTAVLTDAELTVLAHVSTGLSNQQIASTLHISPKTVANHLYRIFRKLGVTSRTEASHRYLTDRQLG